MFSPKIIDTDTFLDMSSSAQNLYFHLGMRADDDGFVSSPKRVMVMCNASEDDMKVLIAKKFIIPFESGVVVITSWRINNLVRKDWYQETVYKSEKAMLTDDDNGNYKLVNETAPISSTQVRLGKVRLGKVTTVAGGDGAFDFQKELGRMKDSKRKDHKIIALYWKKKGWSFENRDQFSAALKRELRAAGDLKGYTGEQIAKAINYCIREYPEIYTLETVGKRITDLVNKKP